MPSASGPESPARGAIIGLLLSGAILRVVLVAGGLRSQRRAGRGRIRGAIAIVPTSRSSQRVRLDPVGALLSSLGLFALVFAIIEAPQNGWLDPVTLIGLTLGALLLVAFVLFELARREPMLDPRLFARRGFGVGSLSLTLQFFAQFGFLFIALPIPPVRPRLLPARGRARDPADGVHADGDLAPRSEARAPTRRPGRRRGRSRADGRRLPRLHDARARLVLLALRRRRADHRVGLALATAPATTAIVSSLPGHKQGIASAVNDLAREVGGALGIAVLGSILYSGYRTDVAPATDGLPGPAAQAAEGSIAAATQIGHDAGQSGAALVEQAQAAFVNGLSVALLVGAGVLFAASVIVAVLAPRREDVARAEALEPDAGTESTAPALASGA